MIKFEASDEWYKKIAELETDEATLPVGKGFSNRELKVDIVLLSIIDDEPAVLLLKRPYEPYKGFWALPGGYIPPILTADEAAYFQLHKKTGLKDVYLEQLALFSNPKRDPNGSIASMAYLSLVNFKIAQGVKTKDSLGVQWTKISDLPDLAFDHLQIIEKAKERMINKIRYTKVGFELAGKKFTLKKLIKTFEAITGKKLDQSNVRKKMTKLNLLKETGEIQKEGRGRPSPVFTLNEEEYEKLSPTECFFN